MLISPVSKESELQKRPTFSPPFCAPLAQGVTVTHVRFEFDLYIRL